MAPLTRIGSGRTGRPMVTDIGPAGPTVGGMEIASDAEFALVGGLR